MEPNVMSAGDTAWVLISAALVLLMVPGLALFYGGLVRGKSVLNTLLMSLACLAIVGVQWIAFGYSLAFQPATPWVGGLGWLGLRGVSGAVEGPYVTAIPHLAFVAFQCMFAVITAALISGAVVERMRFLAFLVFAFLWTTLVYDPLAHWVWGSGGWLAGLGALDFAGGTVVHISAGVSALVAALVVGPRHDFSRSPHIPHDVPLTLLGAGLLWFGWFGFNAGSALAANGVASVAFVTTFTAPAAALAVWLTLDQIRFGHSTAVGAATGMVVGLVAVTPAAGFITPLAAIAVGAIAALASYAAIQVRARTSVDDSLDVFACHGVAGIVGALLTGVFATTLVNPSGSNGLLAGNPGQLGVQAIAVLATMVYAGVLSLGILKFIGLFMQVRAPMELELGGLDVSEHGEGAHHPEEWGLAPGRRTPLGQSVLVPARAMETQGSPSTAPIG